MNRMRRIVVVAVVVPGLVMLPSIVAAQPTEATPAPPTESAAETAPPAVVVEAGTPVPVPLDAVADRLRAELRTVPVQVGPLGTGAAPNVARVTLALSPSGELRIVYRDEGGRIASRIVADTHDPQAVAAAVAMIVANLHSNQVGDALAAIGPTEPPAAPPPAAPAPPAPPEPPAPPAPPVAPASTAPIVVVVGSRKPQIVVASRAQAAVERPSRWGFSAAPSVDFLTGIDEAVFGVETGVDFSFGLWRTELSFGVGTPTDLYAYTPTYDGFVDVEYSHSLGVLRLRRLLPLTGHITASASAGLGLIVSSLTYGWLSDYTATPEYESPDDRSDLDGLASLGGSLEIRVIGRTLFWTTQLEGVLTTADQNVFRPVSPSFFFHGTTGLRLAI